MTDVPGRSGEVGAPFQHGVLTEAVPAPPSLTGDGLQDLMAAILAVAGELELPAVLERFVQVSAELTGARFGAINVLDQQGASVTFVYTGVPTAIARLSSCGHFHSAIASRQPANSASIRVSTPKYVR